jgi:hypothetical protein
MLDDDLLSRVEELIELTGADDGPAEPHVTAEALSCHDGRVHEKQLAMIRDTSPYTIVLCSRRAGKTYGLAALCLLTALSRPRQNILYVGLSKPHARKFLWNEVWVPLLKATGVECKRVEDEMTTTFPNGSVMYVSGTDDVRHIESFLGNRLNLAIIDEAQSQSDSVLVPLTTRILPNALLDDMDHPGKLVMSGTIPEVNAGQFMVTWNAGKWSRHNWSRFENPYLKAQDQALALYLQANPGLSDASPEVQREWYGRFVFDPSATAHRFDPGLNLYDAAPPEWLTAVTALIPSGTVMASKPWPGIQYVSVGIDPAAEVDRMAVVALGWGPGTPKVQHLFEWVSKPAAKHTWNQLGEVLGHVAKQYSPIYWHYDAGSSKNELDTFQRLFGVPVIKAAEKSDLAGQVRMVSGLLTAGKLVVMRGSCLAEDYEKARWDPVALARGQYRWASSWHPDPGDAARYALRPYFDSYVAPPEKPKDDLEAHRAEVRAMLEEARQQDEEANPEREMGWG